MVVCQSDSSLAKKVVSSTCISSFDNGESECESLHSEDNEGMAKKSCSYDNRAHKKNDETSTNFENISVTNSSDVHFGNKTIYSGPVTIKQLVYTTEGTSCDCFVPPGDEGDVNIAHLFRKLSGVEIPKTVCGNSSFAFVRTSDLRIINGVQTQNSISCASQEISKRHIESHTRCAVCFGLPLRYILMAAAIVLVTVLLIVLTVLVLMYERRGNENTVESKGSVTSLRKDDNFTVSENLRIMQRTEWLAQPLAETLPVLTTPVPYVIISHTASEQCVSIAQCILLVRTVQTFHIESRQWLDIGYNFLVGGDGFAYKGRGWDSVGAHSYGYNSKSIGISFIGTFNNVLPPERQLTAAQKLIKLGVELGKISKDYKLLAHRQVTATESPGAVLFQELQKWPHWAPSV